MSEDGLSDCLDEPNMEIQIDTLMGTTFDMCVAATDTIREIKQRIQRVEGIPVHQQNLVFQSTELKDSRRLCDAGIKNGSVIKLVVSMKGGPISTRRLSVSCEHHMMLKELKELLENTRDEIGDKLTPGSKVSVLVFKEGDILNLLRVIENEDGSYSPYSEKPISPPSKPFRDCKMAMFEKIVEDTDMMTKISNLRKKMEDVSLKRSLKKNSNSSSSAVSQSQPILLDESANNKLTLQAAQSSYKLLTPSDLLDNIDLKIFEKSDINNSSNNINNDDDTEEIALKDKHRIKKNRKSVYSESKSSLSHTKQNYARIHKKARDFSGASKRSAELGEGIKNETATSSTSSDGCLPPISKHNTTVHVTRLVLSDGVERPKSTSDSIELEENAQELWEIHEPGAERLKHSATCKVGVLKRRQSLDYGYEGLENPPKQEIGEYNYGEVCSSNFFVPQFVTSPSAIPPQYSPKEQELCDYYITKNTRSPLYGRKSKTTAASGSEAASTLSHSENMGDSSTIHRLTNDNTDYDLISDSILNNKSTTSGDLFARSADNFTDLYGYYNLGCGDLLIDDNKTIKEVAGSSKSSNNIGTTSTILPPVINKKKSRCNECNKRLNITNIYNCRCGKIFCSQHRYSEVHRCSYDYKTEGRRILQCQNPLVTAEKIARI